MQPQLVVVLGATAARAVSGRTTPIERNRGRIITLDSKNRASKPDVLVTVHPSFLLRLPSEDRQPAYRRFVEDLKLIQPYAEKLR